MGLSDSLHKLADTSFRRLDYYVPQNNIIGHFMTLYRARSSSWRDRMLRHQAPLVFLSGRKYKTLLGI